MILAIVLDEERFNATVDLDELPEFVQDRFIKSQPKRDFLEDLG